VRSGRFRVRTLLFFLSPRHAFGTGPHVCPGASLARLETIVVLETLCDRVAGVALVDGFVPVPNPVFWALGHRSLECTLTPLSA
jgi:cytochrome P450